MFYGIIETESLEDPKLVDKLGVVKTVTREVQESTTHPVWHINIVRAEKETALPEIDLIKRNIKTGWYAVYFDEKEVYVIFRDKVFNLARERTWSSEDYKRVIEYAKQQGIQDVWLDFNKNFEDYEKLVAGL